MRINTAASLHAMASLQKDQILRVKKKGGKTCLVVVKKGKLTFCQKIWKWLGCGSTSFNRVLNVIAQIQKERPEELKGKQFTILAGKIEKYKPTFCRKVKKTVIAKLPAVAKLPVKTTKSRSLPQLPSAKKEFFLSNTQCVRLVDYLRKGEFTKIDEELTSEEQQLEFDQILFETIRMDETDHESDASYVGKPLAGVQGLWAHTIRHFSSPSFHTFEKQLESVEKSNVSWEQKEVRLRILVKGFYEELLYNYNGEKEQVCFIVEKFAKLFINQGETNEASTIRFILPLVVEEMQLTKKEGRTLESLIFEQGGDSFQKKMLLKLSKSQTKKMNFASEGLPRWKLFLYLFHGDTAKQEERDKVFREYSEHLDLDKEKDKKLNLFFEKSLYSAFVDNYFFYSDEDFEKLLEKSRSLFSLDKELVQESIASVFKKNISRNFEGDFPSTYEKETLFLLGLQSAEFGFYDFVDSLIKQKDRLGATIKEKCLTVLKKIRLPESLQTQVDSYKIESVPVAAQKTAAAQLVRDLKGSSFPDVEHVRSFIEENRTLSKLERGGKAASQEIAKDFGEAVFQIISSKGSDDISSGEYYSTLHHNWNQFLELIPLVEFGYEEVILKVFREDEGYKISSDREKRTTFIDEVDKVSQQFALAAGTQKLFAAYIQNSLDSLISSYSPLEKLELFVRQNQILSKLGKDGKLAAQKTAKDFGEKAKLYIDRLSPQGEERALFPLGLQLAEFAFHGFVEVLLKNKDRVGAALKANCLAVLEKISLPEDLQKEVDSYTKEPVSIAVQEAVTVQFVRDLKGWDFPDVEHVEEFIEENRALSKLGEKERLAALETAKNYGEAFLELIEKASYGKNYGNLYWEKLDEQKPWDQFLDLIYLVEFGYEEAILKVVRQDEGYNLSDDPTFIPEVIEVSKQFPLTPETQQLFDAYKERIDTYGECVQRVSKLMPLAYSTINPEQFKNFIKENQALSKLGDAGKVKSQEFAKAFGEVFIVNINFEFRHNVYCGDYWNKLLSLNALVKFGYEEAILKVVREEEDRYNVSDDKGKQAAFITEVDKVRKQLTPETQKLFDAYKERVQSSEKETVDTSSQDSEEEDLDVS